MRHQVQHNNFMNKNATPIIFLILAIGIYFTFTKGKIDEIKSIQGVNAGYQQAINNSEKLIKVRDEVQKSYNNIDPTDQARLDKMLPDNVDNVRLTLDVKNIGLGRGLTLRNIKTNAPNLGTASSSASSITSSLASVATGYDTIVLSFNVSTDYLTFLGLLKDLETSLRIIDISKITLTASDAGLYDYGVELKTYWLKE